MDWECPTIIYLTPGAGDEVADGQITCDGGSSPSGACTDGVMVGPA